MPSKTQKAAKVDDSTSTKSKQLTSTIDNELKQEETPPVDPSMIAAPSNSDKENDEITATNDKKEADSDESGSESEEEESSSDDDDEMFAGLSKEEIAKVKAAMNQTKQGYNEQMEQELARQIKKTREQIAFNLQIDVSDEEAQFIAQFVEENNYNLEEQLQDEGTYFLQSMQEMMQQKKQMNDVDTSQNNNNNYSEFDHEDDDDDDEDWVMAEKERKAKRAANRKNKKLAKNTNIDGSTRCGRLLLNDALKNKESMEGWSEARKKAWKNRKSSPNAYFYRFNVPGQPQRNGKWTLKEHELFMKRVRDSGANDKWGIFSKAIPGRVGYQCSNYWRGLVKDGDVIDPNYHYDGKKLHFKRNTKVFAISSEYRKYAITIKKDRSKIWTNLPQRHPKHPSDAYCLKVKDALADSVHGNANKKKRKKTDDDDEDWNAKPTKKRRRRNKKSAWNDDDDDAFHCKVNVQDGGAQNDECAMPHFVDIMTGVNVIRPAISPYGHVLGYDTWCKILRTSKHKNMCPFTLQKMSRRSLVKITKANYDEYKDKITNITKQQTDLLASINKD
eukprot:326835_1